MIRYSFLRFPQGKFKAVTFSYDDGCKQDLRFSEILSRYGMKGTFNLNSDEMRKGRGLSTEEVKEHLLGKGHEIAVHGYNHRAFGSLVGTANTCNLELHRVAAFVNALYICQ